MVKAAIVLTLLGGVSRASASQGNHGVHIRGNSHLLMVGDPGIGTPLHCNLNILQPVGIGIFL